MSTTTVTELITISGVDSAAITATSDAVEQRDQLLARARRGTIITTAESAEKAGSILKDVKAFTRLIESARKEVKERPLQLCRDIDALAQELTAALEAEASRISRLVGAWQAEQNRLAEEQRQKVIREELRIREEAEAKERAAEEQARNEREAREAEARRVQEELAAKAARARTESGRARAEAEAEIARVRAEADAKEAERQEALAQQKRVDEQARATVEAHQQIVTTAPKPSGLATREDVCFEVTDITALYEAAPFLVSLQPNNAAIKAAVKGLAKGQNLPGVRHWTEAKTIVR